MKEARLLHFSTNPTVEGSNPGIWHLSSPDSKGMPVYVDLQPVTVKSLAGNPFAPGAIEAITAAVGEGGVMHGWQVHSIGNHYDGPVEVKNAIVVVFREKCEGKETVEEDVDADDWLCTPVSSTTMGQ